jgi:hypothetical protein
MSMQIHDKLLNASTVPTLLRSIRGAIFPDNVFKLGPAREPLTDDDAARIKHDCAAAIVRAVPEPVRARFFATRDETLMRSDVEHTLDLFADPYINRHLIVCAVELLVVRLFPEIALDPVDE